MSETGFGSLSYDPLPEYNDWGFGSPTPTTLGETPVEREVGFARDTGFGSPFDNYRYPVELLGEFDLIPDDGGVVLKIAGEWGELWDYDQFPTFRKGAGFLGPFQVQYISQSTGQTYQAVGERRTRCFTNYSMDILYAGVQPLPRGDYDLLISWQGINTIIISDAFTVGVRPRIPEAYNIRTHVPSHLKRGPHILTNDVIGEYVPESNLSLILKSVGEALQVIGGRPTTGLASELNWGDSTMDVESTIGFPDNGSILIAGMAITYGSKTVSSFDQLSYSTYFPGSFSIKEEVSCDVTAIK
jgi:hypothetical protein